MNKDTVREKLGNIPTDWSIISFQDASTTVTNGFVGTVTPHYTNKSNGITYVQGFNVRENKFNLNKIKKITPAFHKKQTKSQLQKGDLLTVQSGHIGTTAVVPSELSGSNCHAVIITRFNKDLIDPNYIAYYMNSKVGRNRLRALEVGSSILHINTKDLKRFFIPVPPLSEQQKIAEILGTWDEAIVQVEQLLAALQQRKKGLMQRLLTGQVRFKEFEEKRPWDEVKFADVLNIEIGGTPSRSNPNYWDTHKTTANRWLSISGLSSKYIVDSKEYISDLGVSKSSTRLFPAESVVMSFKLTIGRAAILRKPCYTNEAICSLIPKDKQRLSSQYLYHALSIVNFDKEIDQAVKGKTLNKSKLKRLTLLIPPIDEQHKITAVLETCDDEIQLLQQQHTALQQQKKGLMQRLLTGQLRVEPSHKKRESSTV